MSYYNLCGIGSQHSNISEGKRGGGHIQITGMQDSNSHQGRQKSKCDIEYMSLRRIKKNPEQLSSGCFNYLLNLGRVTSERVAKHCFD